MLRSTSSIRSITCKVSAICALAITLFAATPALKGQTYPTFTSGNKMALNTNYSPAAAVFNGKVYLAYSNQSQNGDLYVSTSTDGVNFTNPGTLVSTVSTGLGYAMVVFNGKLYLAQNNGLTAQLLSTSDGVNWSVVNANIAANVYDWRLGLAVFNGRLYLAFGGNNGSGGPYPTIAYTTDGVNFSSPITVNTTTIASGLVLATYNNKLYLGYTETTAHHPILASSADGSTWSSVEDTGITFGGDPALFDFNQALFLAGRSNFSSDNLWMAGTFDGVNFEAQKEYGQSLTQSPALVVFNGVLFQYGKSNFGTNIWYYEAPS